MATQSNRIVLGRVLLGVIGLLFGLALLSSGLRVFWLSRSGQTTQGRVVAKRRILGRQTRGGTMGGDEYLVAYSFTTKQGEVITGEDKVPPQFWNALKEGDPIAVAYVPLSPRLNWQGDLPGPTEQGFAAFALAIGAAIAAWGALRLAKRPKPSPAGIGAQPIPVTTDDVGLPTLKAERASRALIKGLLVTTAGVLMAGYAFGPRWLAGTPALGADSATDALGVSGIALVALGFPITIIAVLFGSGRSRKKQWRGIAVGLVLMATSGGWIAYHFHGLPASGKLVGGEAVLALLAIYLWMVGVAVTIAGVFYGGINEIARQKT